MSFIFGLLTAIMVVDCLFLILVILVQLPKKEAGMGTAFGGAATDALFGSGTGNALTKMTKYATILFFVLAVVLSVMSANRSYQRKVGLQEALKKQSTTPANPVAAPTLSSNLLQSVATNLAVPKTITNLSVPSPATNLGGIKPATNTAGGAPK